MNAPAFTLSWVIPVHNDAATLAANVARLVAHTRNVAPSEILLVENGSHDASWEVCERLDRESSDVRVRAYREPNAGIGYAYARGLAELDTLHGPSPTRWAVLTGSDLPFGFTDLERALPSIERGSPPILVGSKAHPESAAATGWKRRLMSRTFRLARRALVGMRTGDSQGSFFLRLDVAAELAPLVQARNFFYSTELVYFAERRGHRIVEVPITIEPSQLVGVTTVRPWKHGSAMLKQLVELRRRG